MNKRIKNIFGHLGFGFLLFLIFLPVLHKYTCFSPIFFYLGRERRDHEIKENIPTRLWHKGWNIFSWSLGGQLDFWPVVFMFLTIFFLWEKICLIF